MNDIERRVLGGAFRDELEKISKAQSKTDKALAIAPAVGAVAGGVAGASGPKYFNPGGMFKSLKGKGGSLRGRAVSGVMGAGMGATTGWLPAAFRDAGKAVTSE